MCPSGDGEIPFQTPFNYSSHPHRACCPNHKNLNPILVSVDAFYRDTRVIPFPVSRFPLPSSVLVYSILILDLKVQAYKLTRRAQIITGPWTLPSTVGASYIRDLAFMVGPPNRPVI